MLVRNLLLALGVLALIGGIALTAIWFTQPARGPATEVKAPPVARPAILVAARPITSGTLLRTDDITSREAGRSDIQPGSLLRGQEPEFLGAVTRRDVAEGAPLIASNFVKPSERGFLAAVLKPGTRAVSIAVDASQSSSGLILPGDHVDVILVQTLDANQAEASRKDVVAETVLTDVRAIAIDRSLNPEARAAVAEQRTGVLEAQLPKTVTLEVTSRQAETLLVAGQLGHLGVAVRSLEDAAAQPSGTAEPTWAKDVSPARREMGGDRPDFNSGSTLEKYIRTAPPREASQTIGSAPAATRDRPSPEMQGGSR
jgi:pilus assembly protein CpaB